MSRTVKIDGKTFITGIGIGGKETPTRTLLRSASEASTCKSLVTVTTSLVSQIMATMTMFFSSRPAKYYREWEGIVRKLLGSDNQRDYYNNLEIRPGIDFMRQLANTNYDISRIKLNIPDILVFNEYLYCLYTDENGFLAREPFNGKQMFLDRCEEREQSGESSLIYLAFEGEGYNSYFTNYDIYPYNTLNTGGGGDISGSYNQKLIKPNTSKTMQFFRFFLTTHKASFAYQVTNKVQLEDNNYILADRYYNNIMTPLSFHIMKFVGSSITPMEDETFKIKNYMRDAYGYRLNQLVVDYYKDNTGKYWVKSIHSFTLEQMSIPREEQLKFITYGKSEAVMPKPCPLCLVKLTPQEVRKSVTIKFIMKSRNHMLQRGIYIYEHFNVQSYSNLWFNLRICDLCYTLLYEEGQLMETERIFAMVQHVNLGPDMIKVECQKEATLHHKQLARPPMIPDHMFQWRLMFHFQMLDEIPKGLFGKNSKLYLQYKMFGQTVAIRLHLHKIDMQKKNRGRDLLTSAMVVFILDLVQAKIKYSHTQIPLDFLKMHFFFTQAEDDPKEFFKRQKIQFRITESEDWNHAKLKGESDIFQPILHTDQGVSTGDHMRRALTFQQKIKLFNSKMEFLTLKMIVGVIRDTPELDISSFNLYGESPVFWSDDYYYSHLPFPPSFMDVFYAYLDRQRQETVAREKIQEQLKKEKEEEDECEELDPSNESSILDPFVYKAEVMKSKQLNEEFSIDYHSPKDTWTDHGKVKTIFKGKTKNIQGKLRGSTMYRPTSAGNLMKHFGGYATDRGPVIGATLTPKEFKQISKDYRVSVLTNPVYSSTELNSEPGSTRNTFDSNTANPFLEQKNRKSKNKIKVMRNYKGSERYYGPTRNNENFYTMAGGFPYFESPHPVGIFNTKTIPSTARSRPQTAIAALFSNPKTPKILTSMASPRADYRSPYLFTPTNIRDWRPAPDHPAIKKKYTIESKKLKENKKNKDEGKKKKKINKKLLRNTIDAPLKTYGVTTEVEKPGLHV